ncbi:metal-dependent hydrolase [Cognatishimia activa]|uniref:metal-dependent hydrolase n=1 Tax=Cognatishimia activa TaxID=1715691 RepID=UPI002231D968|nr:metal-dependent hydrolase [Cognatishimia activa]UZD92558.1 metal-dependent hydrolase [Cognatishimia activa]
MPAGYLAACVTEKLTRLRVLFWAVIIGSVFPDIDMLWFHFVDQGAHHHHGYLTHRPAIWAGVAILGLCLRNFAVSGFGIGALLHMALDTIAGAIAWGWPFSNKSSTFVIVQPTHDHWLLSFLWHWTFKVEIALSLLALTVFLVRWRNRV